MLFFYIVRFIYFSVYNRPKLHLVVLDDTGHTKLLVLDSIALQLLHQPFSHAMTPIKDNGVCCLKSYLKLFYLYLHYLLTKVKS